MNTAIQIKPDVGELSLDVLPELLQKRDLLISRARAGSKIVNQGGADKVALILTDLNSFAKDVDAAATEASRPVRALLSQINDLKAELTSDVRIEKARLGTLAAGWRQEQEAIAREEARKRQEELLRLKKEQELAEKKRVEEERAKLEIEEAKRSESVPDKISLEDLKGNRDDYQEDNAPHEDAEYDAIEDEYQKQQEEARLARMKELQEAELKQKSQLARSTPAGMHVRKSLEVEVFDIEALYKSNPACVELKPRLAVIKGLAKSLKDGEEIPGVRITEKATTVVRS